MYIIEAAHDPEVAGSNPAPATAKGPAKQGLFVGATMLFASAGGAASTFVPITRPAEPSLWTCNLNRSSVL